MKLKQYPKYNESGVQWIGKTPQDWKIHRLKFLLSTIESGGREEGGGANLEKGAFSVGGEHVNWDGTLNLENERFISEEYYANMNKGKIRESDILLVKDGATIGKTAILNKKPFKKMAVNEHVFLIRPNERIANKLLYYLICGDSGFKQIKLTEVGSAQGGINLEFPDVVLVTLAEDIEKQNLIIAFLDKKTSKLNTLIEKDKQLIQLLKEKRTALINHVVTKGLNPKIKLKDSGIEWIGKVPEEWEIDKIKRNTYVKGRIGWQGLSTEEYQDTGAFLITGTDFEDGQIKWSSCNHVSWDRYKEDPHIHIREKDLLITKDGTIGKVALITNLPDKTTLNSGVFVTRPLNNKYETQFMYWILNSLVFERFFDFMKRGATILHLYQETFEDFSFPLPSKSEQIQIAEYLNKATSKIDLTVSKIEKKIELLEEYKKSIIYHVVTGKVDVRGVV